MILRAQYDLRARTHPSPPEIFCRGRKMKSAKSSKTGPCKVSRLYDLISGGKRPLKVLHFQKRGISNGRLPPENRSYSHEILHAPVLGDSAHFIFRRRKKLGGGRSEVETGPRPICWMPVQANWKSAFRHHALDA